MELVTHTLVATAFGLGARHKCPNLTNSQIMAICGVAGIFPDIDFGYFLINPLDFLAYWHRAETHSLLLAPLWALLLTLGWSMLFKWQSNRSHIFWLSLAGLISHIFLDLLTNFGVKLLAPVTNTQFAYPLLFVIDGYLLALCACCWLAMWRRPANKLSWMFVLPPLIYCSWLGLLKQQASALAAQRIEPGWRVNTLQSLPQPGSPTHWMVLVGTNNHYKVAYIALYQDDLAHWFGALLRMQALINGYQKVADFTWQSFDKIQPGDKTFERPEFTAFRDFARYPIRYHQPQVPKLSNASCYWYTDLRYHWPATLAPFRFGLCKTNFDTEDWAVYRMRYFSQVNAEKLN